MATIKTPEDIEILREAGKRLARVLQTLRERVVPGVSTDELNALAERLIRETGDAPAFLGYSPAGAQRPYPATLCTSINEEIVHGISNEHPRTLSEGDIVSLDCGIVHKKLIADAAVTVGVGDIDERARSLIAAVERALAAGIAAARAGNTVGDISNAIQKSIARSGFGVVRDLGGHGVGYKVHEEPHISNVGTRGRGVPLMQGMVLALEPIATEGEGEIELADDGYTYVTRDGSRSAHAEHTIVITENDAEILTQE